MKPIDLPPLGEISLRPPASFAAIYDVMNVYGALRGDNAKMARLICACIGLCWDEDNPGPRPPVYAVAEADPVAYGGVMMDWLASKMVNILPIYGRGIAILTEMHDELPTVPEVEREQDFSEARALSTVRS